MISNPVKFSFLDQTLLLFAERTLLWVEEKTLVVADVHLGKTATFRAHGIALPAGTTEENLGRLSAVLDHTGAERLLILGDLLHAKAGISSGLRKQVQSWRQALNSLAVDLILGNHDRRSGTIPEEWEFRTAEQIVEPPFVWKHFPEASEAGYVMAGHIHPAVRLRGPGEQLTLPCFYFGQQYGLLPAFGEFTGYGVIRPLMSEPVFVVAGDELIALGDPS